MSKKIIFLSSAILLPLTAFAAEGALYNFELVPESLESILEIANLLVAIFAATFAVKLAALSQGGSLEKTWNMLAIASLFFAMLEINNSLSGFGMLHIGGLEEIFEFGFGIILAVTFYKTRKQLLAKVLGQ